MNVLVPGAASSPQDVSPPVGAVRRIAPPPAVRRRSTLPRIDYEDAFVVDVGPAADRTGEDWARAVLESAPDATRKALRLGWASLGLRLGPAEAADRVLGWEVRRSDPDFALLGAASPLGLSGEVLFERHGPRTLLFATFLQLRGPVARLVWAGVGPRHRDVVRHLLARAAARETTPR